MSLFCNNTNIYFMKKILLNKYITDNFTGSVRYIRKWTRYLRVNKTKNIFKILKKYLEKNLIFQLVNNQFAQKIMTVYDFNLRVSKSGTMYQLKYSFILSSYLF